MKKRITAALLVIILSFTALCGKLYYIVSKPEYASAQSHIRVKDIATKKGTIYDCNGERLTNRETKTILCAKPTTENYLLIKRLKGEAFAKQTIQKGFLTSFAYEKNKSLKESETLKLYNTFERYSDTVALHLLGYTNADGTGVAGIEKYYQKEIDAYNGILSIAYSADALGRMLVAENVEARDNNYYSQGGIMLTLDRKIQLITEAALKNGKIDKGAAIVLDVKNSAILACASTPVYDRNNIEAYLNDTASPFLNRCLECYPVGSVFKPVTAAAALENDITPESFNCTGYIEKSGNRFNCNKAEGHGLIDFKQAIAFSCNPYFIDLSIKIDADKLLKTAQSLGFGKAIDLGNGLKSAAGALPSTSELNSDAAIGNLGFGQGRLTASPLQLAACFGAIANNGIYHTPYIYKGEVNNTGSLTPAVQKSGKRVLSKRTCDILKAAMCETTLIGTGKSAYTSLFDSCTKTATAQSGQYDNNGNEIKYCWFVGFFPLESPQYVVCILKENGSSGGTDGAPVFKEICEKIYINDLS